MTIGDCLKTIRKIEADCAFLDAEIDNDFPIKKTEHVMDCLKSILHNLEDYKRLIEGMRIESLTN